MYATLDGVALIKCAHCKSSVAICQKNSIALLVHVKACQ